MEIHNVSEDVVFSSVQTIFDAIKKEGNPQQLCLCDQCRLDTICYTLNRIKPQYIVSNRGFTRIEQDWTGRQQIEADIAALIYRGMRLVHHNHRPTSAHDGSPALFDAFTEPAFFIPAIAGRLFDGETFAPLSDVTVGLYSGGELVRMRNRNWQNPFTLISHTPGAFTFWPTPVQTDTVDVHRNFEYSLKIESSEYETMTHFFKIPTVSVIQSANASYTLERTFKLPDLYLFRPGEAEQNG